MQEQITSTFTPNQNDVLAGRGCGSQLYPGNVNFRNIVKSKKKQYALLKSNRQKNELAFKVLQEIKSLDPPGRFLSKSSDGNWTFQDEKVTVVKIKQALRERSGPRPKSPNHNVKSIPTLDTGMVAKRLIIKQQDSDLGSFTVTKHYSDFRAFLISDFLYLISLASDDDHQNYIKRFLARVYISLTWEELSHMCNYHYEESGVEDFLKAIWKLYPFLSSAYYIDSRRDRPIKDIRICRIKDTNRKELKGAGL